jgi:hypothetical protein
MIGEALFGGHIPVRHTKECHEACFREIGRSVVRLVALKREVELSINGDAGHSAAEYNMENSERF